MHFGFGDKRLNVYWPGFKVRSKFIHVAVGKSGFYTISQERALESDVLFFLKELSKLDSNDPSVTPDLSVTNNENNKQILFFERELRQAAVRSGDASTDWNVENHHTENGEAPVLIYVGRRFDSFYQMNLKTNLVDDTKEMKFLQRFFDNQKKRRNSCSTTSTD